MEPGQRPGTSTVMSMPVIRAATIDDVAELGRGLEALAAVLGDPQPFEVDLDALERHGFREDPAYHALLAVQDGVTTGFCIYFREFSTWRCRPGIYVQDLFINAACRGRGLGRALLTHATSHARDAWQAAYLRLAVHVMNHDAVKFYQALGFEADQDNQVMLLDGSRFAEMVANRS